MGRGERQINDPKNGRAFEKINVDRPGGVFSISFMMFENSGRGNVDLGEIYIFEGSFFF